MPLILETWRYASYSICSSLVQENGHCFLAPSHHLKQYWLIVKWTLVYKLEWNLNQNAKITFQEKVIENIGCEMSVRIISGLYVLIYMYNISRQSDTRPTLAWWNLLLGSCTYLIKHPLCGHLGNLSGVANIPLCFPCAAGAASSYINVPCCISSQVSLCAVQQYCRPCQVSMEVVITLEKFFLLRGLFCSCVCYLRYMNICLETMKWKCLQDGDEIFMDGYSV